MELRGHHLICLNFLTEAFGPEFTELLMDVRERALAGEEIKIIEGPDELCRACPLFKAGRCEYEEDVAEMDEDALEMLGLKVGDVVRMEQVRAVLRQRAEELREFCEGCEFLEACRPQIDAFLAASEA
ncbi:DUF1284 domain-containing protein [Candidatus Bathyarchaeota archaeon]|nr:MAG: DUF1284 domain-containing protein [Candidatus Bathyarchaeota archaeon]